MLLQYLRTYQKKKSCGSTPLRSFQQDRAVLSHMTYFSDTHVLIRVAGIFFKGPNNPFHRLELKALAISYDPRLGFGIKMPNHVEVESELQFHFSKELGRFHVLQLS
jgi:hypothetical protein